MPRILKIYWQPGCPKCPNARELGEKLKEQNYSVEIINVLEKPEDVEKYDLMATPILLVVDENDNVLKEWRGAVPSEEELKQALDAT